ncbi:hypothetical protein [Nonomuraea salmonea]|uniref:hypothetical protein n=1 Tax=Nonomuraea salmonea TaxID=46181 RepID=UPI002FEDD561
MRPTAPATGTVIHEVFRRAYERGDRPALVDLRGGHVYGYRRLVTEVTRAASGLVRRGARRDQVVGVHVSTAGGADAGGAHRGGRGRGGGAGRGGGRGRTSWPSGCASATPAL